MNYLPIFLLAVQLGTSSDVDSTTSGDFSDAELVGFSVDMYDAFLRDYLVAENREDEVMSDGLSPLESELGDGSDADSSESDGPRRKVDDYTYWDETLTRFMGEVWDETLKRYISKKRKDILTRWRAKRKVISKKRKVISKKRKVSRGATAVSDLQSMLGVGGADASAAPARPQVPAGELRRENFAELPSTAEMNPQHALQLAEMNRQHALQLTEMNRQHALQLTEMDRLLAEINRKRDRDAGPGQPRQDPRSPMSASTTAQPCQTPQDSACHVTGAESPTAVSDLRTLLGAVYRPVTKVTAVSDLQSMLGVKGTA